METSIEFKPVEYDEIAEIPTLHLSFIIQSLLPVRLVGWQTTKRHYENIKSSFRIHEADVRDVIEYVLVGSIAEGYSIPNTIVKSPTPPRLESFSDIDALFVNKQLNISTKSDYDKSAFKGYCDFSGLHPGYTRVCLPTVKEQDEMFIYDKEKDIYFMSSKAQQEKGFHDLKNIDIGTGRTLDAHGPAISLEYTEKATIYDWEQKNAGLSQDIVLALPCYPWPEVANAWKSRGIKSAWLDNDFVQSIIDDGCHVVAVPHKKSSNPDIEWRLSFSASEGRLGREAVTDNQRQCFIFIKILRHQVMKSDDNDGDPLLSSYVFKSVFLHCCENLPKEIWKDNPGYCVLYVIDVLLERLNKKHVPSYFLPDNNIISHLEENELQEAKRKLRQLRQDPITPILQFTDNRLIGLQPATLDFRQINERLLIDMKAFKQHRNIQKSVNEGVFVSAFTCCLLLLLEETKQSDAQKAKYKEAVHCMVDIFPTMQKLLYPKMTLVDFMNLTGISIPDLKRSLHFYEAAVDMVDIFPDFCYLRGNYACMCHAYAYSFPKGKNGPREEFLQKAESVFRCLHAEGFKRSTIDFVTYLMKQSMFSEARPLLENFIDDPETQQMSTSYGKLEIDTLDDVLKKEVETHGKFSAESVAFAYYYLIVCLSNLEPTRIPDVLEKFETFCSTLNKGSSYALLGHAYYTRNEYVMAEIAFKRCKELWPEYKSLAPSQGGSTVANESFIRWISAGYCSIL